MEMKIESGKYTITCEDFVDCARNCVSYLLCSHAGRDRVGSFQTAGGRVEEVKVEDERVLCLVHYAGHPLVEEQKVVLHTFDMELRGLSEEVLATSPDGWFQACMDDTYIYILHTGETTMFFEDASEISRSVDVVAEMTFTRINRKTGERTEWRLDDLERDNECTKALKAAIGEEIVTSINALCVFDGKLVFECDIFDLDSTIETDDPDFDEDELEDSDYVAVRSDKVAICADLDAKTFSKVKVV